MNALKAVEALLLYGLGKGLAGREDVPFCRNLLLDALGLPAPQEYVCYGAQDAPPPPATAAAYLDILTGDAAARGVIEDTPSSKELLSARLMGCLTARPSEVCARFACLYRERGPQAATDWFYQLCRDNDYIRVDAIARNLAFSSPSPVGQLDITINLSKPEKDPRDIARALKAPKQGYPPCLLCVENPGYAGRADYPARQNHRMVPLRLDGEAYHLQYSPYLYYNEHCIVLSDTHRPMRIGRDTFCKLFDFVEQFPHYFIGSNADLPIVGGSILSHDHFQGGRYVFPMMKAPLRLALGGAPEGVKAGILNWPLSTLRLQGADSAPLMELAGRVLTAWRQWSDAAMDILSYTDAPHNTITPILRRVEGTWILDLVLRNNRTTAEHPMGLFHPHSDLHHIKRENIGLIEVMGLFILPGRLKAELGALEVALQGETPLFAADTPLYKHTDWFHMLRSKYGVLNAADAHRVLLSSLADKCARVLEDAGVYKQDEAGIAGFLRFTQSIGLTKEETI